MGAADRLAAPLPREWRGLRVAEPARCAAFEASDYAAGGFLPPRLPDPGGGFREPLGCSLFAGPGDFAVGAGRVVSAEAAHDAGLCARPEARAAFGADPDNRLYLPAVLAAARAEAVARGDGDWLPGRNLCWYVGTQLRVRRRYGLSVSPWEARLFEAGLRGCPAVAPAPRCDARAGRGVVTAVDRLVWWPWIRLWRFLVQFHSRRVAGGFGGGRPCACWFCSHSARGSSRSWPRRRLTS